MKKLKISQLAPGFRYLQTLALKSVLKNGKGLWSRVAGSTGQATIAVKNQCL